MSVALLKLTEYVIIKNETSMWGKSLYIIILCNFNLLLNSLVLPEMMYGLIFFNKKLPPDPPPPKKNCAYIG